MRWLILAALALALTVVGPLATAATARFAPHEVVHLVLLLVLAPAFVVRDATGPLGHLAGRPLLSAGLYTLAVVASHLPSLDAAALDSPALHLAIHAGLLGAGVLLWQQAFGRRARLNYPLRIALLLLATGLHAVVGGVVAFTDRPLYAGYADLAASERTADQALAGVLFWIPPKLVFIGAITLLFFRWLDREDEERRVPAG